MKVRSKQSSRIYDTEGFIKKSKDLYPGRISDYSEAVYAGSRVRLVLFCVDHGKFETTPEGHFNHFNCPSCSEHKRKKNARLRIVVDVEEFIKRSNDVHGNRYDYSLVDFQVQTEKVDIICPLHGVFRMEARTHIRGRGCRQCWKESDKPLKSKEHFLKKAGDIHKSRLDFSNSKYSGIESTTVVRCTVHDHEFETTPHKLYRGYGCPLCWHITTTKNMSHKHIVSDVETILYHVRFFDDDGCFDKVGITTKDVKTRFDCAHLEGFRVEIVSEHTMKLSVARECERSIMENLEASSNRFRIRKLKGTKTAGWTECFPTGCCDVEKIVEGFLKNQEP